MRPSAGLYRIQGTILPAGDVRDVFVRDGRFTFEELEDAETLLTDCVLLPGLVDAHAHLAMGSPAPPDAGPRARAEASAAAHLAAGVLLIREPGSPDHACNGIGADEHLPRVITAGRFLALPGHYIPGLALEVEDDALPEAAEAEFRVSDGWVKVIGDSFVREPRVTRTYSAAALEAAAERVHGLGGRVAIHAMSGEVVDDAIAAGCDSIEHGTFIRAEQLTAMAARGIAWTPTRSIDTVIRSAVRDMGWPTPAIAAMDRGLDGQPDMVAAAVDAGVTLLAGTDAGATPHGTIGVEVRLLLEAGVPADAALGAASWTARTFLGMSGIDEGAPADLIAYRDDPRHDPSILAAGPALRMLGGEPVGGRGNHG